MDTLLLSGKDFGPRAAKARPGPARAHLYITPSLSILLVSLIVFVSWLDLCLLSCCHYSQMHVHLELLCDFLNDRLVIYLSISSYPARLYLDTYLLAIMLSSLHITLFHGYLCLPIKIPIYFRHIYLSLHISYTCNLSPI